MCIPQPVCEWLLEEAFTALNQNKKQKKENTRHLITNWQWKLCKLYFEGFWFGFHFFHYGSASCWGVFADKSASSVHIYLLAVKVTSGKFLPLCNWLYPRTANNLQLLCAKQSGNSPPVVVRGSLSALWHVWLWPQFPYIFFYSLGFGAKITLLGLGNTMVWVKIWPSSAVALHI